jgi:hypothetical protein
MVGARDGSPLAIDPQKAVPLQRSPRRRPQPALVISLVALFVALGGTSYAAIMVTGENVRNGSLTGADIRNESLRGKDVRNGSLTSGDLSAPTIASLRGSGPRGAKGATGPRGATGAAGAPGTFGVVTMRRVVYSAGSPATALCLTGEVATGGGVSTSQAASFVRVSEPFPNEGTPRGWTGQVLNTSNTAVSGQVYAICAQR